VIFPDDAALKSGERLLKRNSIMTVTRLTSAALSLSPPTILRVQDAGELSAWLDSNRPLDSTTYVLSTEAEFAIRDRTMAALASMGVKLPQLLSSVQDQIFVLDRDQRMVAFFGHWPEDAPIALEDLIGKRKRDVFSPAIAARHEEAAVRALTGGQVSYEWCITDGPQPVHLYTVASPLLSVEGAVVGVLLVTRNITQPKQAQFELEAALKEKTADLREVERGIDAIAAALRRPSRFKPAPTSAGDRAALSARELEVLNLLRSGMRLRSVAQRLGISVETARRHVKAMFRKTGVHSQESLLRMFSRDES
jgi:DNA-binding CsgD family transcriptional regulator/PAS domain-containing protein